MARPCSTTTPPLQSFPRNHSLVSSGPLHPVLTLLLGEASPGMAWPRGSPDDVWARSALWHGIHAIPMFSLLKHVSRPILAPSNSLPTKSSCAYIIDHPNLIPIDDLSATNWIWMLFRHPSVFIYTSLQPNLTIPSHSLSVATLLSHSSFQLGGPSWICSSTNY